MKTALIICAYNQPEPLRKTLLGVLSQTERNFETLIADDGSTAETAAVLRRPEFAPLNIRHLWIPDRGFRKTRAMNLAVASTDADYCIFLDGDSVPRKDFVEAHLSNRRPKCFLAGSRIHIPEAIHRNLSDEDILSNRLFDLDFLMDRDPKRFWRMRFRIRDSRWKGWLNFLTNRPRVWFGANSSGWRKDIVRVNGWNESFGYGSDDREFGMRLSNAGVTSRYLKFSLVQAHLDHPYHPNHEVLRRNRRKFQRLFFVREWWSPLGIDTVIQRDREEQAELRRTGRAA